MSAVTYVEKMVRYSVQDVSGCQLCLVEFLKDNFGTECLCSLFVCATRTRKISMLMKRVDDEYYRRLLWCCVEMGLSQRLN